MDEEEAKEGSPVGRQQPVWWPGRLWFGRKPPPRHDPSKTRVVFQPLFREVGWDGEASGHVTQDQCSGPPRCSNPGGPGKHTEVRPDGFMFEGIRFASVADALVNQAFQHWYEEGGREIVEAGEMVLRAPLYEKDKPPPEPPFGFRLMDHFAEMTSAEVAEYRRIGTVPVRFRHRGPDKKERRRPGPLGR